MRWNVTAKEINNVKKKQTENQQNIKSTKENKICVGSAKLSLVNSYWSLSSLFNI